MAEDQSDLKYVTKKLKDDYQATGLEEVGVYGNRQPVCGGSQIGRRHSEGVDKCKLLGVTLNKLDNSINEIVERMNKRKNVIRELNSILWDRKIRKETKNKI